jgi:hypothetical protein
MLQRGLCREQGAQHGDVELLVVNALRFRLSAASALAMAAVTVASRSACAGRIEDHAAAETMLAYD